MTLKERTSQLDEIETAPEGALRQMALERLHDVLERAHDLPFYRERFAQAGVDSGAIESIEGFSKQVPAFKKSDLIEVMQREGTWMTGIEALGPEGAAAVVLTSGTLGFPTFASLGQGEFEHGSPREVMRELWMDGLRPGMRVMCMYPAWHHLSLMDNWALEQLGAHCLIPWGTFTPEFAGHALDLVSEQRPEYILTATNMLHAMVDEANRRGLDLKRAFESVRFAMVAGEPVSPRQRQALIVKLGLEDFFERGGSSDGLWGGAECPAHAGHHLWLDHHYLEIVDPETGAPLGPGQRGSAVVTSLTSDRSIYVRFDTEDLGELLPTPCPCGRTHPRFELYGRLADCVKVQGRLVAPYDVRYWLDEVPELLGVPCVIGKNGGDMDELKLFIDGDARKSGLDGEVAAKLEREMGLPVEVGWAGPLPKRWKVRMTRSG